MSNFIAYGYSDEKTLSCSYGSLQYANDSMYSYHIFRVLITFAVSTIFIWDSSLSRMYSPLAKIINISFLLQFLSAAAYLMYYPYQLTDTNCTEVFLSRLCTIVIIVGEIHQTYFLATVLGLRLYHFNFRGIFSLTISHMAQILTILTCISILLGLYLNKEVFMIVESLWTILISTLQIYLIRLSRNLINNLREDSIISPNGSTVLIFENLSLLQVIPSLFIFIRSIFEINGKFFQTI